LSVGAKPNVPLVQPAKIELKKMYGEENKNTKGSAVRVGLLVVLFKYGLYVRHLSKWFVVVKSLIF